jgi:metal-sulfur cluster biosynthetic enzyme
MDPPADPWTIGVGRSPTHGDWSHRPRVQWRWCSWVELQLDAARAWAPRRIQERGRRAKPDPRGLVSPPACPVAMVFVGRAAARRGEGLGTATHPGTRASGEARPTGIGLTARVSSGDGVRGSSCSSTRRGLGYRDASRNAGVGRSPTHGDWSHRPRVQWRWCSWVELQLDAARAWVPRRIQERGRRAKPDPRGSFAASTSPVARAPSWVEHRSTLRRLGHRDASRNAGVGRSPTHGGSSNPPLASHPTLNEIRAPRRSRSSAP